MEVDGLDGNWVDGVDPSVTPHVMDPCREEYEQEIDDDIRARAQQAPPPIPMWQEWSFAEEDLGPAVDDKEFEVLRKELIDHFYYLKHNGDGIFWKKPPPPLLEDLREPRFIAK